MDYSKPLGQHWTYKAMTLDRSYADDMRLHLAEISGSGGVFVRWINGQKFLFVTLQHAKMLGVYRFASNSEIAIPCGLFYRGGDPLGGWPPNRPPSFQRWIWFDTDGDGSIEAGEYLSDNPEIGQGLVQNWGWYVDSVGDVWTTGIPTPSGTPPIRQFKPTFSVNPAVSRYTVHREYPAPVEFNQAPYVKGVMRAYYDPASDSMYLSGYTPTYPEDPVIIGQIPSGEAGRVIYKHTDRASSTPENPPQLAWGPIVLPYGPSIYSPVAHLAESIAVAGNRVYVAMVDTREVLVHDATTGAALPSERLFPGPEVSAKSGLVDIGVGINAFQRANGEYLVLEEDDGYAKNLLYHESHAVVRYQNDFTPTSNPFSGGVLTGGTTARVLINGNPAISFQDTKNPGNRSLASLFILHLDSSDPLVERISQIYSWPTSNPPVSFELSFKLERTLAAVPSSGAIASGITGGVELNTWDNFYIPRFPTGIPEPSLLSTAPYVLDDPAGCEVLASVDPGVVTTYRFTVVPNGGQRSITGLDFRFRVYVDKNTTPEAYVIDDLTVYEIVP